MCSHTFLERLDSVAKACNHSDYMKYVKYAPRGLHPLPGKSTEFGTGCDVWDEILNAALLVNPASNTHRIFDMVITLLYLVVMAT